MLALWTISLQPDDNLTYPVGLTYPGMMPVIYHFLIILIMTNINVLNLGVST